MEADGAKLANPAADMTKEFAAHHFSCTENGAQQILFTPNFFLGFENSINEKQGLSSAIYGQ